MCPTNARASLVIGEPRSSWLLALRPDRLAGRMWVVVVEPCAGLDPQSTLLEVTTQQPPRPLGVLRGLGAIVLFDIQHDIQADLVHHPERAGPTGVELEHLVDFLRRRHAFGDDLERLPLHRCPNSVEDETSALPARFEWVEPEVRQRLQYEIKDAAVGLAAGHDVDSILFWRHVEVDVQYALWAVHLVQEHA